MQAKLIKLEDLKVGDEVIMVWYEYGHLHGVIQELKGVNQSSFWQSEREFRIDDKWHNVVNSDFIYLVHRLKK